MYGVSQAVVHLCIKEVTSTLFKRASYQTNSDIQAERAVGSRVIIGFPLVQGVIDCTHMSIKTLMDQPAAFINRKGFHSINMQLVCDHQKHFLQVCARFSGSSHNAYILQQFQAPQLFRPPARLRGWIFSDNSYPLATWLLAPVRNPHIAAEERNNTCHGSTGVTIEQATGLLKMRFRCLDQSSGALQFSPVRVSHIVVVCCALHNLAQQRGGEALHDGHMNGRHSSTDEEDVEEGDKQAALDVEALALETGRLSDGPRREETVSYLPTSNHPDGHSEKNQ
ncbi:putative nuclease HARBI1 [Heterodontus francisci]|uniref:putative nuclease HARBI1 n=1 Tax=Heterodontus francisci TaxID=7792 RepID=UPI00355C7739